MNNGSLLVPLVLDIKAAVAKNESDESVRQILATGMVASSLEMDVKYNRTCEVEKKVGNEQTKYKLVHQV